jgi:hypothetical protein
MVKLMSREASKEASDYRTKLRKEEKLAARRLEVIVEMREQLLGLWVRDLLIDPGDFEVFIGQENVAAEDERIDWREADRRVKALLRWKPHLGVASDDDVGGQA